MNRSLQMLFAAASVSLVAAIGYQYYSQKQLAVLAADVDACLQKVVELGDHDAGYGNPYGDARITISFIVQQCNMRSARDEAFRLAMIAAIEATQGADASAR